MSTNACNYNQWKDNESNEIFNILTNAICKSYSYTIKGSFNGKVGIHCAIEAAKNNNDIENQKLLELYAQRKKIPNNFYELYLPLQSINQEPNSSDQVYHDYGASFSLDYLGI